MWIYESSVEEKKFPAPEIAEAPIMLPEKILAENASAATEPEPENQPHPVPQLSVELHRRKKPNAATLDCWLLGTAFLLGSAAAGVLQAVCDVQQSEMLGYYLDSWRTLFAVSDLQNAVHLFGTEYAALGSIVSLFLLLGLSALGPVLIFGCMMFYGLGSGVLLIQLSNTGGWKNVLLALLWTGIPAAVASGCLCWFGASALQVSSRIRAYSFWNRPSGQASSGIRPLLGQYLLTMVLLLPLCGAAAGLSCLGNHL